MINLYLNRSYFPYFLYLVHGLLVPHSRSFAIDFSHDGCASRVLLLVWHDTLCTVHTAWDLPSLFLTRNIPLIMSTCPSIGHCTRWFTPTSFPQNGGLTYLYRCRQRDGELVFSMILCRLGQRPTCMRLSQFYCAATISVSSEPILYFHQGDLVEKNLLETLLNS